MGGGGAFRFLGVMIRSSLILATWSCWRASKRGREGRWPKKEKEKWDSVLVSKRSQSVGATVRIKVSFSKTAIKVFFFKAWNYDTNIWEKLNYIICSYETEISLKLVLFLILLPNSINQLAVLKCLFTVIRCGISHVLVLLMVDILPGDF